MKFKLVLFFMFLLTLQTVFSLTDGYTKIDVISVSTSTGANYDTTGYGKSPSNIPYGDTLYFKIYIEGNLSGNPSPLNASYNGMSLSMSSKFYKYSEPVYTIENQRVKGTTHYYAIKTSDLADRGAKGTFFFKIYNDINLQDFVSISLEQIQTHKLRLSAAFEGAGNAIFRINYTDNTYSETNLKMFSSDINNVYVTQALKIKDITLQSKGYGGNNNGLHTVLLDDKVIATFTAGATAPIKWIQ